MVDLRFYRDPATGQPHIWNHDVDEVEVREILANPGEDRHGRGGSRVAIGQTTAGRYLKVVYVRDPKPDSAFVITAFELQGKALLAYRRRQRRKLSMKQTRFPAGWSEARTRRVLEYYERQTDSEAAAEDEVAFRRRGQTVIVVPSRLVPEITRLIQRQGPGENTRSPAHKTRHR